jgi:heme/copper-type cytochrome/quinol oxidase subunit 2
MKRNVAALALLLAVASPALGQGCAMCYTGAENAGSKSQQALDRAVIVMLVPTLTFIGAFAGIAYKYRNPRGDESEGV